MFTIDAHLDLATNAISLNRDLRLSVHAIRAKERQLNLTDTQDRGNGTVSLPALRQGNVGLVVATLIARYSQSGRPLPSLILTGWHSPEQAYAFAQAQLAWYNIMEAEGEMKLIRSLAQLDDHVRLWQDETISNLTKPIGYVLSLEGADSIINLRYIETYYANGLRAIGPAHFGPGRYAAGTHSDGSGLTKPGRELLHEMDRLSIILDVTHLTDTGFWEAISLFKGPVWASHQNCRSIVRGERQFSDDQLKAIIERDGVVGGALDAWMLAPDFPLGGLANTSALGIDLARLVDHFDHICQLSGNSNHIAFGTDLDGLFGREQTPFDLDTIADLAKFEVILQTRGYSEKDIQNVFSGNWLRLIRKAWNHT